MSAQKVQKPILGNPKKFKLAQKKHRAALVRHRAKSGRYTNFELNVRITNRHAYVTIYDKSAKTELSTISTANLPNKPLPSKASLAALAKPVAEKIQELKIDKIYLNRRNHSFHGRISALVAQLREAKINI